jgi:hypothetical protein
MCILYIHTYIYIIHIYIYTHIYMICVLFDLMFHNILRYFFLDPFVTSRQFRPWGGYGSMELDLLKGRPKLRRCRFLAKIAHFGLVNGWWIWFVKVQNSISGLLKSEKSERVFVDNCLWGFLMTEQCETICIVSFCVDFITMDANHLPHLPIWRSVPVAPHATCYTWYTPATLLLLVGSNFAWYVIDNHGRAPVFNGINPRLNGLHYWKKLFWL